MTSWTNHSLVCHPAHPSQRSVKTSLISVYLARLTRVIWHHLVATAGNAAVLRSLTSCLDPSLA